MVIPWELSGPRPCPPTHGAFFLKDPIHSPIPKPSLRATYSPLIRPDPTSLRFSDLWMKMQVTLTYPVPLPVDSEAGKPQRSFRLDEGKGEDSQPTGIPAQFLLDRNFDSFLLTGGRSLTRAPVLPSLHPGVVLEGVPLCLSSPLASSNGDGEHCFPVVLFQPPYSSRKVGERRIILSPAQIFLFYFIFSLLLSVVFLCHIFFGKTIFFPALQALDLFLINQSHVVLTVPKVLL